MPFWLFVALAGVFGLVVGSYANVLVSRLPRGESTVRPRSRCPECGSPIAARDNVPILSWILLRGRCRSCAAAISPRYPVVEAITGGLFALATAYFGIGLQTLFALLLVFLLVSLAAIDVEHLLLPDKLTLPGLLVGLLSRAVLPESGFLDGLLGAVGGAGFLILVINFWYWLRSEEGMGMGDVNMLAMIGAFLGWRGMLVAFAAAVVLGAAVGVTVLALRRGGLGTRLPFGLFLALGGLMALFAGDAIVGWYLGRI
ncbi:MAG: prepilin peptidase [Thermoanaerobaculia bacterium]